MQSFFLDNQKEWDAAQSNYDAMEPPEFWEDTIYDNADGGKDDSNCPIL
jgi:hypothetical protein